WAMVVVLAKLGTSQMVGLYALGLAVTQPVISLAQLSLRSVQATDARREYQFSDYLRLRLVMLIAALLVIAGVSLEHGSQRELALVIGIVGLGAAFDAISDVFYGLQQQHERMDRIAISMAIKGPLSLVALSLGVYVTGSVVWAVAGSALASALTVAFYDIPAGLSLLRVQREVVDSVRGLRDGGEPAPQGQTIIRLLWLTLPMGVTMLLVSLNENMSRYFVEHYLGAGLLGIYAAVASLLRIGGNLGNALGQSASPRLAKYYAAGDYPRFKGLLRKLVGMGVVMGASGVLVAAVAGRAILRLLFKREYADHVDVLVWLMAAGGLGYVVSFLGYAITAARRFTIQIAWYGLAVVITGLTSWWLVPMIGLRGAAVSAFLSEIVVLAGGLAIVAHVLRPPAGSLPVRTAT
ncbi:MAG: oligosaccharide flippase family protein, partial [Armatimonadota bacterium]|nr:oligosaccharide flippase family protein [Armatimonadota bacterium]